VEHHGNWCQGPLRPRKARLFPALARGSARDDRPLRSSSSLASRSIQKSDLCKSPGTYESAYRSRCRKIAVGIPANCDENCAGLPGTAKTPESAEPLAPRRVWGRFIRFIDSSDAAEAGILDVYKERMPSSIARAARGHKERQCSTLSAHMSFRPVSRGSQSLGYSSIFLLRVTTRFGAWSLPTLC